MHFCTVSGHPGRTTERILACKARGSRGVDFKSTVRVATYPVSTSLRHFGHHTRRTLRSYFAWLLSRYGRITRLHLPFASPEGEGLEPRRGQLIPSRRFSVGLFTSHSDRSHCKVHLGRPTSQNRTLHFRSDKLELVNALRVLTETRDEKEQDLPRERTGGGSTGSARDRAIAKPTHPAAVCDNPAGSKGYDSQPAERASLNCNAFQSFSQPSARFLAWALLDQAVPPVIFGIVHFSAEAPHPAAETQASSSPYIEHGEIKLCN